VLLFVRLVLVKHADAWQCLLADASLLPSHPGWVGWGWLVSAAGEYPAGVRMVTTLIYS